jgi:hypothetical protein
MFISPFLVFLRVKIPVSGIQAADFATPGRMPPNGQRAKLSVDIDVLLWIRWAAGRPEYLKKRNAFSLRLSEHNCCQREKGDQHRSAFVLHKKHEEFRRFRFACVPPNDVNIIRAFVEGLTMCQSRFLSASHRFEEECN